MGGGGVRLAAHPRRSPRASSAPAPGWSRPGRAYGAGTLGRTLDADGQLRPPILTPSLPRSLRAGRTAVPHAYGWGRPRWSGAPLAVTRPSKRGITVSAETRRRGLHALGWVWKRATRVAQDDDLPRVERVARIRGVYEPWRAWEALVCADELAMHLRPKVGGAWMPTGTPLAVMPPGQHQQHSLAGALDLATGTRLHGGGPRQTNARCRDLLGVLEERDPAERYTRLDGVVDHEQLPTATAGEQGRARHPRITLLFLPTSGPRANPIERAVGEGHEGCPRHHRRTGWRDLGADVEPHVHVKGPWPSQLSQLSYEPAVTAAVAKLAAEE